MKKKTAKPRNPRAQDATLINIDPLKRLVADLLDRTQRLERILRDVHPQAWRATAK